MKSFFLGVLLYPAAAVSIEHPFRYTSQVEQLGRHVCGLRKMDMIRLPEVYEIEKRATMRRVGSTKSIGSGPAPQALKNAVSSLAPSFARPTSSRSPPPASQTLGKPSSKRKDPGSLTKPTSQRRRISELSDNTSSLPLKSNAKALGKPPLHPSFKNTPEYRIKMQRIAASKDARVQTVRRNMDTNLPDASFLSDSTEHRIGDKEYPSLEQPVFPPRPPPFRSQAVDRSPGRLIAVP